MLPQFPPSWGSQGWGQWHGWPSIPAKLTLESLSSLPQSQVQPFELDFFVLSTRRSISSALPFVPAGFSPLRMGMALKILLIMAEEDGFWSTPGVSCAAYTRWTNKHLA